MADDWMTAAHKAAALEGFRSNPVAMAYARQQAEEERMADSAAAMVAWMREQIAVDLRRAERIARDPFEGMTDDELHAHRAHPAYEYATTEGQRKAWPHVEDPPENDAGWELNTTERNPDAFERFDYTEERYWRRLRPDGPIERRPSPMVPDMLAQCEAHTAILDEHVSREVASMESPTYGQIYMVCRRCAGGWMCQIVYPCPTVRAVALAYQHRPGFREEWRP